MRRTDARRSPQTRQKPASVKIYACGLFAILGQITRSKIKDFFRGVFNKFARGPGWYCQFNAENISGWQVKKADNIIFRLHVFFIIHILQFNRFCAVLLGKPSDFRTEAACGRIAAVGKPAF